MTTLDPVVIGIAVAVVLLQVIAFYRTVASAGFMRSAFDVGHLQVRGGAVDTTHATSGGAADGEPRFRFSLQPTGGEPTRPDVLDRINLDGQVARPLDAHLRVCREVLDAIAEQHEARAAAMVGTPVYLGLMGTFAGIIAGLVQLAGVSGFTEDAIRAFLAGVLVAMVSSFSGVTLMVVSSALVLPSARRARDERMAALLDNVKMSLIGSFAATKGAVKKPALVDAVDSLVTTLKLFGESIEPQRELVKALEKLNLPNIAKVNTDLLARVQPLLEKIAAFDKSIAAMTAALNTTNQVVTGIHGILDRIRSFEASLNTVGQKIAVDDLVTRNAVEWVKKQIESLQQRAGLVEQYINEQDFRVKDFAMKHGEKIEELTRQASQTLVDVGERIAREVEQSAEPERVKGLLQHVAVLPAILTALNDAQAREAAARRELSQAVESLERSARQISAAVTRLDQNRPSVALMRGVRSMFSRRGDGDRPPGAAAGLADAAGEANARKKDKAIV